MDRAALSIEKMKELLSPKQVASSIGVSESSLKRWCDQGVITTERTPGGHRRIRIGEVIRFLRKQQQHPILRPEVLGLPSGTGHGPRSISKAKEALLDALELGDNEQSRRIVLDLFLSGNSVLRICEDLVTPVLHSIGDGWECGRLEVFQEHRACEIVNRLLYDLRTVLPPPEPAAPVAMGGTPPGDNYRLASLMVELLLVDEGWKAISLGSSLPYATMAAAAQHHAPSLFWLSFSHVSDSAEAASAFRGFLESTPFSMKVVIGGQQLGDELASIADGERAHFCAGLEELREIIAGIRPARQSSDVDGAEG